MQHFEVKKKSFHFKAPDGTVYASVEPVAVWKDHVIVNRPRQSQ